MAKKKDVYIKNVQIWEMLWTAQAFEEVYFNQLNHGLSLPTGSFMTALAVNGAFACEVYLKTIHAYKNMLQTTSMTKFPQGHLLYEDLFRTLSLNTRKEIHKFIVEQGQYTKEYKQLRIDFQRISNYFAGWRYSFEKKAKKMVGKTLKTVLDQEILSPILKGLNEYVRFFIDSIPTKGLSKRGMSMPITWDQYNEMIAQQNRLEMEWHNENLLEVIKEALGAEAVGIETIDDLVVKIKSLLKK